VVVDGRRRTDGRCLSLDDLRTGEIVNYEVVGGQQCTGYAIGQFAGGWQPAGAGRGDQRLQLDFPVHHRAEAKTVKVLDLLPGRMASTGSHFVNPTLSLFVEGEQADSQPPGAAESAGTKRP
jgi:hypothetical protein